MGPGWVRGSRSARAVSRKRRKDFNDAGRQTPVKWSDLPHEVLAVITKFVGEAAWDDAAFVWLSFDGDDAFPEVPYKAHTRMFHACDLGFGRQWLEWVALRHKFRRTRRAVVAGLGVPAVVSAL